MWNEQHKAGLSLVGFIGRDYCRVDTSTSTTRFTGTYLECVKYLKDRNCW